MTRRSVIICDDCQQEAAGVSAEPYVFHETQVVREDEEHVITMDIQIAVRRRQVKSGGLDKADVCDPCRVKSIENAGAFLLQRVRQAKGEG